MTTGGSLIAAARTDLLGAERTSTIGRERAATPLLSASNADTFVARLTGVLSDYPVHPDHPAELNRRGPAMIIGQPALPALNVDRVRALPARRAFVVGVHPVTDFADGHMPGAAHIGLGALPHRAADLRQAPYVVMCGHGEGAASLLVRAGRPDL